MTPRKPSGRSKADMAKERQRRYREKALQDPDGKLLTRLQVLIEPHAAACLERIVVATGKTKREVIELAIIEFEQRLDVNPT